jgi:hypothetical protein
MAHKAAHLMMFVDVVDAARRSDAAAGRLGEGAG